MSAPFGGAEHPNAPAPSLGELLGEVSSDLSTLMRQELALAKAEAQQTASRAGKGAGMLAGAGVAGHLVLVFLSLALMWGLAELLDSLGWASVIVAALWAVIAAVLAVMGRAQLKKAPGMDRTVDTAKRVP